MGSLISKVKKTIDGMGLENKLVIVAISGGPDSVALVHILKSLGLKLHLAHLNHDLRGKESEEDAAFVERIAQSLFLPYTIEKRKVSSQGSIQQEARKVRYDFLKDVCTKNGTDTVLLAQHADDQLETVLMNFFRGAGLTGLSGIKKNSTYQGLFLIRPLLECSKEEILLFLEENSIQFRIDSSNKKEKYLRNRFRLKIIPYLQKSLGFNFKDSVLENIEILKIEDEYMQKEAESIFVRVEKSREPNLGYDLVLDSQLSSFHKAMIARVIRLALGKLYNIRDFTSQNILDVVDLCLTDKPGSINLPNNIIFVKWDNNLAFYRGNNFPNNKETVKINLNQVVVFGTKEIVIRESKLGNPTHEISAEHLKLPLIIRSRKAGDRIKISLGSTKKIKDIFIDAKIPKHERDNIPIMVDNSGNIIAILGYRVNPEYYIDGTTNKKIYIYVSETGGR